MKKKKINLGKAEKHLRLKYCKVYYNSLASRFTHLTTTKIDWSVWHNVTMRFIWTFFIYPSPPVQIKLNKCSFDSFHDNLKYLNLALHSA